MVYPTTEVNSMVVLRSSSHDDSALLSSTPPSSRILKQGRASSFFGKLKQSVNRNRSSRKRVRFSSSGYHNQIINPPEGEIQIVEDVWYSKAEYEMFRANRVREAKRHVARESSKDKNYMPGEDPISRTFEHCLAGDSTLPSKLSADLDRIMRHAHLVGVDKLTSKTFCSDVNHRQKDLKAVVRDLQKCYQPFSMTKESVEALEVAIQIACQKLTQPHALLAHHMAEAIART
mmetsp:Transcript_22455/g.52924  ORF Transcript_22455/g.52924 Transcript_22455/m.52924 type:complete len:232 (+) Transcript_22455:59-754(+)